MVAASIAAAMFAAFDFVISRDAYCLGLAVTRALLRQLRATDEKVAQLNHARRARPLLCRLLILGTASAAGEPTSPRPPPPPPPPPRRVAKLAVSRPTPHSSRSRAVNALPAAASSAANLARSSSSRHASWKKLIV